MKRIMIFCAAIGLLLALIFGACSAPEETAPVADAAPPDTPATAPVADATPPDTPDIPKTAPAADPAPPGTPKTAPVTDATAPGFTLADLAGEPVSLEGLKGSPVLLNFWATWCGPCRDEMPYLQDVAQDERWRKQGLVVLAVNQGESHGTVSAFMQDKGYTMTVLLDEAGTVGKLYAVRGIPTTFFIDENGIIRDIKVGPFSGVADLEQRLINTILEDT